MVQWDHRLDSIVEQAAEPLSGSDQVGTKVRLLLHGKRNRRYKIYFAIHHESETVRVFHVRHWARTPLTAEGLEELMEDQEEN